MVQPKPTRWSLPLNGGSDDERMAKANRPLRRFSVKLGTLSVVAVAVGVAILWRSLQEEPYQVKHPETGFKFPTVDQISSVTVDEYYHRETETDLTGEIPKKHWPEILNALQPSEIDPHPLAWTVMGQIRIQTNDGQTICIALGYGGFCAGDKPWSPTRKYFIYGRPAELEAALTQIVPSLRPVLREINSNTQRR